MKLKNKPQLTLMDVLRKRHSSLKEFLHNAGIQSYEGLLNMCRTLGVAHPDKNLYDSVSSGIVTSQQDGIIVVEPMPVIEEITGKQMDEIVADTIDTPRVPIVESHTKKRNKKKKNEQ